MSDSLLGSPRTRPLNFRLSFSSSSFFNANSMGAPVHTLPKAYGEGQKLLRTPAPHPPCLPKDWATSSGSIHIQVKGCHERMSSMHDTNSPLKTMALTPSFPCPMIQGAIVGYGSGLQSMAGQRPMYATSSMLVATLILACPSDKGTPLVCSIAPAH